MHPISLEQLTVAPAQPPELIRIAAATGCRMAFVSLKSAAGIEPAYDLARQPDLLEETRRRAADLGVEIRNAGSIWMQPTTDIDSVRRSLDTCAQLGAGNILVVGYDPDPARTGDWFLRICEESRHYGLGVILEPVSYAAVSTMAQGAALASRAGRADVGVLADVLHLYRAGGSVADLADIEPRLIRYAQLCDGPLRLDPEKRIEESRTRRGIPGEGELPLAEFLRALPEGIPVGVEVPLNDLAARGSGPMERARLALEATRRILRSL